MWLSIYGSTLVSSVCNVLDLLPSFRRISSFPTKISILSVDLLLVFPFLKIRVVCLNCFCVSVLYCVSSQFDVLQSVSFRSTSFLKRRYAFPNLGWYNYFLSMISKNSVLFHVWLNMKCIMWKLPYTLKSSIWFFITKRKKK